MILDFKVGDEMKKDFVELLLLYLPTIIFLVGLILINVSVYYIFNPYIGMLASGITLVLIGLIMTYEQTG